MPDWVIFAPRFLRVLHLPRWAVCRKCECHRVRPLPGWDVPRCGGSCVGVRPLPARYRRGQHRIGRVFVMRRQRVLRRV